MVFGIKTVINFADDIAGINDECHAFREDDAVGTVRSDYRAIRIGNKRERQLELVRKFSVTFDRVSADADDRDTVVQRRITVTETAGFQRAAKEYRLPDRNRGAAISQRNPRKKRTFRPA